MTCKTDIGTVEFGCDRKVQKLDVLHTHTARVIAFRSSRRPTGKSSTAAVHFAERPP
jgi:hypothetical protein